MASQQKNSPIADPERQPRTSIFDQRFLRLTVGIIITVIALGAMFTIANSLSSSKCQTVTVHSSIETRCATSDSLPKTGDSDTGEDSLIVTRRGWSAELPSDTPSRLYLPSHRVVIAHTATEECDSTESCILTVRNLQNLHKYSRSYQDIAYNFLVGGDGHVYEGRGWDIRGAHTKGYNDDTIGIAFIGTFTQKQPPEQQLNATIFLLANGVRLNKLVSDYKLFGSRQLIATESPGEALFQIIKSWPNFSDRL